MSTRRKRGGSGNWNLADGINGDDGKKIHEGKRGRRR